MFIKDNLKQEREMEGELSGGLMAVGIKDSSEMESRVAGEYSIEKVGIGSMKATGTTVCSMVKELNTLKTDSDTMVHSSRINSMERVYSTKTIPLYTEYGKTMSYQW